MKKKILSKILTLGVLINSIPVNSFVGILSEDGRYETFTGNNITVNDVLEEDKVNIKVEGNTLVNLIKTSDFYNYSEANNSILLSGNSSVNNGLCDIKIDKIPLIKPNSKYTFIYNVLESTTSNIVQLYNSSSTILKNNVDLPKTIGVNKVVFETKDNIDSDSQVHGFYIHLVGDNSDINDDNKFIFTNTMILEGDWTNRDIPEYFEGIQSGFENNLVTQEMIDSGEEKAENLGKYKVEVKSTGKNLWNGALAQQGMFAYDTGNDIDSAYHARTPLIKVKPNTQYSFNMPNWCVVSYYDINKNIINYIISTTLTTFTTPNNCYYIRFRNYVSNDNALEILSNQVQLEEGSISTKYEPFKESINTFYLNSPLLEGDTIEIINGQATHVKRYTEMTFDGSDDEGWKNRTVSFPCENTSLFAYEIDNFTYGGNSLCDKFIKRDIAVEVEEEGFLISVNGDTFAIYIRINKDKLSVDSISGFKEWLKNNPTKVIYRLRTPIYEPIKADLSLQLFEGTTHISNNSNIPVNMEITVNRIINRAVEAIELAKTNPTIENLSKARMWVNLLDDSIKKDELQSDINNITNIDDLELERKTVSANVDIYIKSENSLSMTLSTNSIMFEDYSGVSDIEKLNALEITVNSSLPYDLNAYLESEIQNNDKSTTIDSNLLQIKESSNLDYKTFNNTTDKVILEEDCPSGNYNKHNIDLKMEGSNAYKADVYKTVIKFEAEQK